MKQGWKVTAVAVAVAVLQGCGGDGDGIDGVDESAPEVTSFPTLDENVYRGVANPGELVKLTLDPVAKTYSLVVVESQFGVTSAPYTGSYREDAGTMVDTVDPEIAFMVANGQAYGNFKVRSDSGAVLEIAMVGTNQTTTQVTDLAGFYSFVQLTAAPDGSGAQPESGQMKIGADGSVRVCEAQGYVDGCKSIDGGDIVLQLVHVGDGRWNIKAGDFKLADFYPRRSEGVTSFLIDYAFTDDTGARVGTGMVASDRNLVPGALDGSYICFSRGNRVGLTVSGATASDSSGTTYSLTYNLGGSWVDGEWRTFNAGALLAGEVSGVAAPRGRMVAMPLSTKELVGSGIDTAGQAFAFACLKP